MRGKGGKGPIREHPSGCEKKRKRAGGTVLAELGDDGEGGCAVGT